MPSWDSPEALTPAEAGSLDVFFNPRNVAVIGATDKAGSVGRIILSNLLAAPFGGSIFPVNPRHQNLLGQRTWPGIADVPAQLDLAVIVTPAGTVPDVIRQCAAAGVRGAVVISAGFRETGPEGAGLEEQLAEEARRGHMRVIGPNCLGVMNPLRGLNATFAASMAKPGQVGFISQSGALCTAILDWSLSEMVGFSAFLSVGSMVDVGWGDLIRYLGNDPQTRSIVIYMEAIGDARSFLSAAREVTQVKPIIVIKAGRTAAAAKAAASHTGSLAGSDEVLDAAFRRCGVLRVDRISDLFYMADVFDKQPRPRGPRLTILTNAGGPGVLATDALISEGGTLSQLTPETMKALDQVLPPHWSHQNPIDIIGDAGPERYAQAIEIAAKDENSDGLLVILTPQGMTDPSAIAARLKPFAHLSGKPVLASWMGGAQVAEGVRILNEAGIPAFSYPDTAALAFEYLWRHSQNLSALYETPSPIRETAASARESAAGILRVAREHGRTILTEYESKQLLEHYGIPTVPTLLAATEEQALEQAKKLSFPVVLKLNSTLITHKTDVGGVRLNLNSDSEVLDAFRAIRASVIHAAGEAAFGGVTVQPMIRMEGYELILGSSTDPQVGPVLLFGSGGQLVEILHDRALALPPLNTTLARHMIGQTLISSALKGVRGRKPVDQNALEELVVRFSELITDQHAIREMDINPLLVSAEGIVALDARVVLHAANIADEALPRPAIAAYPWHYVWQWAAPDGTLLTLRPIRPEDEKQMVRFHGSLSEESVHHRYLHVLNLAQRIGHERLAQNCSIDYSREMALVAEQPDGQIIGVARLARKAADGDAEFALVVSDRRQNRGIGTELLRRLIEIARQQGICRITGDILVDNRRMLEICRQCGFRVTSDASGVLMAVLDLRQPRASHISPQHGPPALTGQETTTAASL